jgi:hypothetical protein
MKTNTDTGFEVGMVDVYTEFSEKIVNRYKIGKFKSKVNTCVFLNQCNYGLCSIFFW